MAERGTIAVGDHVTSPWSRGPKRVTYVDNLSVMVQITPVYEQAYGIESVTKVDPEPHDSGSE